MQYWEIVTHAFQIAWRHKYLWLLALFSAEGGGGKTLVVVVVAGR